MRKLLRVATYLAYAAITYLILAAGVSSYSTWPTLGSIGFTIVFVLFSLLHSTTASGAKATGAFFAVSAIVSFALEEIGVRTGAIYGHYHYSDLLGPKLGHVPVVIPLAWFMMIYPSWMVAGALLKSVNTSSVKGVLAKAAIAAFVMTAWDVLMDPGMAAAGNWIWERGGAYFGVPVQNYAGWLLTTFLVYAAAGFLERQQPRSAPRTFFERLPILVYTTFALRYVLNNQFPQLQVVAAFAMLLPGLVAIIQSYSEPVSAGVRNKLIQ